MTLQEGYNLLKQIPNKPFYEIFAGEDLSDIIQNKGRTGQLLEKIILHLNLSNTHLDFDDGELKTNKCKADGTPDETMAVCQISSLFDQMISPTYDYTHNYIMDKLANMLYVRTDKSSTEPIKWKFFAPIHVSKQDTRYTKWYKKIEEDLQFICQSLKTKCDNGQQISSTRGPGHYIQIRTKDSAPYHPIYSQQYGYQVSDKNYAIYITKEGLQVLININKEAA